MTIKYINKSYIYYKNKDIPTVPEDIFEYIKGIIYVIKNKVNNKLYVGQTMSHSYNKRDNTWSKEGINKRWLRHLKDAKSKTRDSHLYKDILVYGEDNFEIEIYKIIPIKEIHTLNVIEYNTIKELNSEEPNGYNIDIWKNSTSFTKYIFLKYFNLEEDIPSLNSNKTSKDRAKQICLSQDSIRQVFSGENIEELDVRLINLKGKPNQVRIIVKLEGETDRHRTSYYLKNEPIDVIQNAIKVAKELKENAFIDPRIITILNEKDITATTYKYQKRLDEALKHDYIRISGLQTYYSSKDFYSYLLILSRKNDADIRYSFGGKTVDLNIAYKDAKEFVDKILEVKKVNNVIIREPESCHQQQATTKVAKITFVD